MPLRLVSFNTACFGAIEKHCEAVLYTSDDSTRRPLSSTSIDKK
nr:MAG TPA: hypothetical protein [Caudoviricetes sp.]